jgi:hypothetical protein
MVPSILEIAEMGKTVPEKPCCSFRKDHALPVGLWELALAYAFVA